MRLRRTNRETVPADAPPPREETRARPDVPEPVVAPVVLRPDVPSVGEASREAEQESEPDVDRSWPGYRAPAGPDGGSAAAASEAADGSDVAAPTGRTDIPAPGTAHELADRLDLPRRPQPADADPAPTDHAPTEAEAGTEADADAEAGPVDEAEPDPEAGAVCEVHPAADAKARPGFGERLRHALKPH